MGSCSLATVGCTHPTCATQSRQGNVLKSNLFARDAHFGAFCAQGSACCKISDCSSQQSQKEDSSPSPQSLSWQCFENLPRCISGGMVPVASSEDSSTTSTVSPSQWSPMARSAMFLALLPRNSQQLFLWVQISGVLR